MRVRAENGRIDEIVFNRGLLLVAERVGSASYTVDYQGDIDAIFDFEPGAEITLHVRQMSANAEQAYAETYVIGETVPLDIGDCRYDVTVIDSFGETPCPRCGCTTPAIWVSSWAARSTTVPTACCRRSACSSSRSPMTRRPWCPDSLPH